MSTNAEPSPDAQAQTALLLPLAAKVTWKLLESEPSIGVSIVDGDGLLLYANLPAIQIFIDPQGTPEQYVGKNIRFWAPAEWVDERLRLFANIMEDGKPRLLRTIWKGRQQYSWLHPIDPDEGMPTSPKGIFLVITRRIHGDTQAVPDELRSEEVIESQVAQLGKLDKLTTRELEVLALMNEGLAVKDIAAALHRSPKTIENHRNAIGKKLKAVDRNEIMVMAKQAGLTLGDAHRKRL